MASRMGNLDSTPAQNSRQWGRTPHTRAEILNAAEAVFQERGYIDASIAHIVERSGVSVGSIYHHFGGKAEVFLALWEENQSRPIAASTAAVALAKTSGQADPVDLFLIGAKAYLEASREHRRLATMLLIDGGPPGFEELRRLNWKNWIRQNTTLLGAGDEPAGRVLVSVVTSIMGDGARELALLDDPNEVKIVIDITLEYAERILRG